MICNMSIQGEPEQTGQILSGKENFMEEMTKEEMQRYLIKEAQRGSSELEAYRNLMEILGIEYPNETEKSMK